MKNVGNNQDGDCWNINRVEPQTIEFWQGQSNRIHDRLRFGQILSNLDRLFKNLNRFRKAGDNEELKEGSVQGEEGWLIERLAP